MSEHPHLLYLIGATPNGPVKIGVSSNLDHRLVALQRGCHLSLRVIKRWHITTDHIYRLETIAHYELRQHRLNGEWFGCSPKEAIIKIQEIMHKTNKGADLALYGQDKLIRSITGQKAGRAAGIKRSAVALAGAEKIRERWKLPNDEWRTDDLLKEGDISRTTANKLLGHRPRIQRNYQAALKRKAAHEQRAN